MAGCIAPLVARDRVACEQSYDNAKWPELLEGAKRSCSVSMASGRTAQLLQRQTDLPSLTAYERRMVKGTRQIITYPYS